eukprot:CAMPEP_0117026196 /NCGR_PEP_ID=MMETSP0472-20121206/19282_1 /TAXON_ID=693140 ORGANISM="Tiarina fusus, Strain LIS" /NCGR_SAMPLE_ID=MMETSP0472 /ASSEMBLY_ACC=CAM_ASM_000603 /LENGTH=529 /DNA_ID=CAMNT_0004733135 /DNA_START=550 /DNA_END=2140 /DNA_ORIENTATION=+
MRAVRVAPPTSRFHFALQTLTLSHLYVSVRSAVRLRKGLEATKQLTTLKLDCVQFERCAICQIAQGVEANTTLQTLDCHWIASVDAYVMMHSVQAHPTLREIHFRGDCISDAGSTFVGKGMNEAACQLQALRLTGLGVFDLAPMISEIHPAQCRLQRLDLSDNLLQNYQIDYLFLHLHKFPILKEINLSRNRLSDFCEAILSNPDVLSHSLTTLDLTYNRLTDHAADEFLTHLWKFPNLGDLNLSRNRLHKLDFVNFLREPRTYRLRRLSLFHPHFSLLEPGEAVHYHGWPNYRAGDSFASRLLMLLQRTPHHVKIGSFWACKSVQTQHLLDVRQVSIADDPTNAPVGLWPHMLAQANELFCNDESRQANAVFYLLHQGAPCFLESRQPRKPAVENTINTGVDDEVAEAVPPSGGGGNGEGDRDKRLVNVRHGWKGGEAASRSLQEMLNDGRKNQEQSSEFMTCSMQESEFTDQSYRTNNNNNRAEAAKEDDDDGTGACFGSSESRLDSRKRTTAFGFFASGSKKGYDS